MAIFVELDFETLSLCDLKLCGAEVYSEDPSTEIICLVYKWENFYHMWWPGCEFDVHLSRLAADPAVHFVAHNAAFEQAIWRNRMVALHGFPPIPVERWHCTLASCAYKGMRLSLDKVAIDLRLHDRKDLEGNKLTLGLSKFETKKDWMARKPDDVKTKKEWAKLYRPGMNLNPLVPEVRERVIEYCKQDVVVEDAVLHRVGLLKGKERQIWMYDQTINQRGVRIDLDFAHACQRIINQVTARLLREFQELTGLAKIGSPKLLDWCLDQGVCLDNLQKKTLAAALEIEEDDPDPTFGYAHLADEQENWAAETILCLPPIVRRVLEIRQALGGAAIKKIKRMLYCTGSDGRARGLLQYHAAHSGRWGGRLLQPQNFPRDSLKGIDPDVAVQTILSGDPDVVESAFGLPVLDVISRCLRHALVASSGQTFLVGDYAQIEARIVLALAGQYDKCAVMAAGQDVYVDMARSIFAGEIDKERRQAGKAAVLGLGFQCGASKFQYMAEHNYGVSLPIEQCEAVVETYRKEWAPKVPPLWYEFDRASLHAVEKAQATEAYGVVFKPEGEWLTAALPNGWQKLWYYSPSMGISKFDLPCWTSMQSKLGKWIRVDMYGGLETENVVQALARGLLCAAIDRLERAGFPVVLTVHDEIICEVDKDKADEVEFSRLMAEPTEWSDRLKIPVAVESWTGTRYKK